MRNRSYLIINVAGLGLGIASFLILSLYIHNDLTYNHFNRNLDRIYRIREGEGTATKGTLLPKMLEEIPEVENGTRIFGWDGFRVSNGEIANPENVQYADTGFFTVFSFPFIEGNARLGIHDKFGVVISKEVARKYFGNEPALGKKLRVKFENVFLQVNGVVNIPENSSVKFGILGSYETGETLSPWMKDVHDWYNTFSDTYVLLKKGTVPQSLQPKLDKIVQENFIPVGQNKTKLNLMPFRDFHAAQESNHTLIIVLIVIAIGILSIAIVNFINLNIAGSFSRTKEIGIRRAAGATNWSLFSKMMKESLIVSFIALLVGLAVMSLMLPVFNRMFGINLRLSNSDYGFTAVLLASVWLFVGLLSGLIPSYFWARTRLVNVIHGKILDSSRKNPLRFSLVVVQFAIAIVLISGTLLIRKQIRFMMNTDPRFDKENVFAVELDSWQYEDLKAASAKYRYISEELKASPYVEAVCFSQSIPGTYQENYNSFVPEGASDNDKISLRQVYVGRDYFKTYGIKIISGEGFDRQLGAYKDCIVVNESAMKKLGITGSTGQVIHSSSSTGYPFRLTGISEDFVYQGVQKKVEPLVHFFVEQEDLTNWGYLSVRSKSGSVLPAIARMRKLWEETEPKSPFSFVFTIDKINDQYKEYVTTNRLIGWFSILAILLSCTGLFALSSYLLNGKTKEIGIRKVNGARLYQVIIMLSSSFLKWVIVAIVISVPVAWYALHKWLELFPSKTELSWWIFAVAGFCAILIAQITVSWHSWKAAVRNPVEALRYE
jgi:putative ABC transport system permease protein